MADAFAPTAEFSIAQEQPVAGVENRATETAVRGLTNLFGNLSRTGGGSSKGPQPDPLMADFIEQMEVIEAQRASGQSVKATMNERRLVANYISAGGDLNAELKSVVEATTGRPFDYYGQTEGQRQYQAMVKTEEFQTAFKAARATNPGRTEEEYIAMAQASVEEQALAVDALNRTASGEKLNWETRLQPAYTAVLDAFKGGAVAGLLEITASGGTLTPDEVLQAKLQWDLVKQELSKPAHISDTQWQQMQGKVEAMDKMFVTMEKLASSEHAMNNLQSTLLAAAQQGDTTLTLQDTVAILGYLKDPAAILTSGSSGFTPADAMKSLLERTEKGMKIEQDARLAANISASNPVPTDPNSAVIPDGNVIFDTLPEEYEGYSGMEKDEVVGNLKASIATISALDAQAINAGNGADQDLADAYGMVGAAMMGASTFLSSAKMKEAVGNPDAINAKLDAIAGRDPEAAIEARVMLRSGLQSQLNMLQANEKAIMEELKLQWDPEKKRYFIPDSDSLAAKVGQQWYSGSMTESGFYIDNNQPTTAPVGWFDLVDRRGAIDAATNGLNGLALPQEEPIEQAPTPENLEGASLSALSVAQEKLGWSETDGVDKLTDFLKNNGQNIDPTETAWCAAFVNATLNEAGLNGTGLLNAKSFLSWGEEVTEPVKGDIVVLERGTSAWQGHVGFFQGFDSDGNIMILGGNQGDAVSITSYPASRLLGYRRATGEPLPVENPDAQFAATALANVMSTKPNNEIVTTALGPAAPEEAVAPEGAATDTGVQTFETEGDFLQAVMDDKVMNGESVMVAGELTTFEDAVGASNLGNQGEQLVVPDPETSPMGPDGEDQPKREAAKPEPKYKKLRDLPVERRDTLIQEIYAVGGTSDTKVFEDINDVMDSIFAGEVKEGDVIVVGGRVQVLAYEDK